MTEKHTVIGFDFTSGRGSFFFVLFVLVAISTLDPRSERREHIDVFKKIEKNAPPGGAEQKNARAHTYTHTHTKRPRPKRFTIQINTRRQEGVAYPPVPPHSLLQAYQRTRSVVPNAGDASHP